MAEWNSSVCLSMHIFHSWWRRNYSWAKSGFDDVLDEEDVKTLEEMRLVSYRSSKSLPLFSLYLHSFLIKHICTIDAFFITVLKPLVSSGAVNTLLNSTHQFVIQAVLCINVCVYFIYIFIYHLNMYENTQLITGLRLILDHYIQIT